MTVLVEEASELRREVARRRTFAIISHPDAGKTTLTEKLLLYGGAIDVAGAGRTPKAQRHATSDWMSIEQSRGISLTPTLPQFEDGGRRLHPPATPAPPGRSHGTHPPPPATPNA